jgi:hypothetical protein
MKGFNISIGILLGVFLAVGYAQATEEKKEGVTMGEEMRGEEIYNMMVVMKEMMVILKDVSPREAQKARLEEMMMNMDDVMKKHEELSKIKMEHQREMKRQIIHELPRSW